MQPRLPLNPDASSLFCIERRSLLRPHSIMTNRSFWPVTVGCQELDKGFAYFLSYLYFTQRGWVSGWAVSPRQKKSQWVRLGWDPTQLCPELERLSLAPGSLLPSAGHVAAVPDCNGYCSSDLVGWFEVCCTFFEILTSFPVPFPHSKPSCIPLLLSFKCTVFSFSLIVVTLMHAYRNWILLKLQKPGTAFPSNGRWGRQR